ncbi:hypothetical protein K439DRAFT_1618906 [Ramaria rubella]|nr:hypothetical protein K439DRAFT_1618906 [Ramaria rubella]
MAMRSMLLHRLIALTVKLTKHKHPEWLPGATAAGVALTIPEFVCHKSSSGWVEHIPLTVLTDAYCTRAASDQKTHRDTWQLDETTSLLLSVSKPISAEGESQLTFTEWHQAWHCLLALIEAYIPEELLLWKSHFTYIRDKDDTSAQWELFLTYDIEIWLPGGHLEQSGTKVHSKENRGYDIGKVSEGQSNYDSQSIQRLQETILS